MKKYLIKTQASKQKMTETFHIALDLDYAEKLLAEHQHGNSQLFQNSKTGEYCSDEKAFAKITEYKKLGYTVIPPCDNIDADGCCAGHKE